MVLTGLPLQTLLLIGGAAAAAIVVFYILKLRRRPVPVPFSRLWERVLRDKEATTWFARLKRLLSLLLQLLLLACLLLALGDPRQAEATSTGRHIVVLIDTSASMKAIDVAPSRLGVAKERVRTLIKGLAPADRMLLVRMDAGVTPITTMTGDTRELEAGLELLQATDTAADLRRGLELSLDSLRDLSLPEIMLVTDGALGDTKAATKGLDLSKIALSTIVVGERGRNVAITGFSVRRYPLDKSRYEVMLEVTNTTAEPQEVELTLLGDGNLVDVTKLTLKPEERLPRFYKELGGASRKLEAVIRLGDGSADDFPADDHAYALMPERRRARVLTVTPGNTYLEAALLLDEYLDVETVAPASYPPPGKFDVTIFDTVAPLPAAAHGSLLYIAPPADGSPVRLGKPLKDFGFDSWEKKHPMLRFLELGDIQVTDGPSLEPDKDDRILGFSGTTPILVEGRRNGRRFVVLGFDPRKSDMVLRVAWPLLLLNVIDAFVTEDTRYVSSYKTGTVWYVPAPAGLSNAKLQVPSGEKIKVPIKEGHAVHLGTEAGFYELDLSGDSTTTDPSSSEGTSKDAGKEASAPTTLAFAANLFDPQESQITPNFKLELGERQPEVPQGFNGGARNEPWTWILLVVIVVSIGEWLTFHRRVTV